MADFCRELALLTKRVKELEKKVSYLSSRPAQYVPPPVYGPLPTPIAPTLFIELSSEAISEIIEKVDTVRFFDDLKGGAQSG